jgi:predicted PurR-regulated permease PerM
MGGLRVFGFNGILLGPLIIILFFTIVDIALEEEGSTAADLEL